MISREGDTVFRRGGCVRERTTGLVGKIVESNQLKGSYLDFESTQQWIIEADLSGSSSALYFLRRNSKKASLGWARSVALLVPPRFWYRTVLRLSQMLGHIIGPVLAFSPYRGDFRRSILKAWLMNSLYLFVMTGSESNGSVQLIGPKVIREVF